MTTVTLPFPPSTNTLYRNVPGRGRVKTQRYVTWQNAAGWEIKEQRPPTLTGPYTLYIRACRPDKRRRDLGNLEKAVSDLLVEHAIVSDDRHCERLTIDWSYNDPKRIAVTLLPYRREAA